ncbi:MAG: MarR family winged helix-turn-helix transcriptional regulator [Alphaproteobacteria bacterium]
MTAPRREDDSLCTCFKLRRATRRVTQIYDRHLHPTGLRITQFGLLARLRAAPLHMTELADRMGMDRTTLTRNLRPLERLGYVAVDPGEDRRTRTVAITPVGRLALSAAAPRWREAQAAVREALGPTLTEALHGLLDRAFADLSAA